MATASALLKIMTDAAKKAAKGLVRDFGELENLQVSKKGLADFVSAAHRNRMFTEATKGVPRHELLLR